MACNFFPSFCHINYFFSLNIRCSILCVNLSICQTLSFSITRPFVYLSKFVFHYERKENTSIAWTKQCLANNDLEWNEAFIFIKVFSFGWVVAKNHKKRLTMQWFINVTNQSIEFIKFTTALSRHYYGNEWWKLTWNWIVLLLNCLLLSIWEG